jgi:hypothetical protein
MLTPARAAIDSSGTPVPPVANASVAVSMSRCRLRPHLEQALLAPIRAAHTLLTPMIERGPGAALFTLGASARGPIPQLAQGGVALAGLRHHLFGLADAAQAHGVRVGMLTIGGLILGSDLHHEMLPDAGPDFPGALDPDELATHLGDLLTGDDHPERLAGPYVRQTRHLTGRRPADDDPERLALGPVVAGVAAAGRRRLVLELVVTPIPERVRRLRPVLGRVLQALPMFRTVSPSWRNGR